MWKATWAVKVGRAGEKEESKTGKKGKVKKKKGN